MGAPEEMVVANTRDTKTSDSLLSNEECNKLSKLQALDSNLLDSEQDQKLRFLNKKEALLHDIQGMKVSGELRKRYGEFVVLRIEHMIKKAASLNDIVRRKKS